MKWLKKLVGLDNYWHSEGYKRFKKKQYKEALDAYNNALQIDSEHIDALTGKCLVLIQLDKAQEAKKILEPLMALYPRNFFFHTLMGTVCESLKEFPEALKEYQQAVRIDSKPFQGWRYLSSVHFNLGNYSEALATCEEAIERNSKDVEVWNIKGKAAFKLGKFEEAQKAFEQIIAIDPNNISAQIEIANILTHFKKYPKALEICKHVLEIEPNDLKCWMLVIRIYSYMQNYPEILKACDQAIEQGADRISILKLKGAVFNNCGQHEEAIKVFTSLTILEPADSFIYLLLGSVFKNLGKQQDAIEAFKRMIDLESNTSNLTAIGNNLAVFGYHSLALSACEKAIVIDPKNADAWNKKGNILFYFGQYSEASSAYKKAYEVDEKHVSALMNRGFLAICENEFSQAEEFFSKVGKVDSEGKFAALIGYGFLTILQTGCVNGVGGYFNNFEDDLNNDFLISSWQLGRGFLAYDRGEIEQAENLFAQSLKTRGDCTIYHYLCGLCFIALDDPIKAEESFKKVIEFVPDHKPALETLTRIQQDRMLGNRSTLTNQSDKKTINLLTKRLTVIDEALQDSLDKDEKLQCDNNQLQELIRKKETLIKEQEERIQIFKQRESNSENERLREKINSLTEEIARMTILINQQKKENTRLTMEILKYQNGSITALPKTFLRFFGHKEQQPSELCEVKVHAKKDEDFDYNQDQKGLN